MNNIYTHNLRIAAHDSTHTDEQVCAEVRAEDAIRTVKDDSKLAEELVKECAMAAAAVSTVATPEEAWNDLPPVDQYWYIAEARAVLVVMRDRGYCPPLAHLGTASRKVMGGRI